MKISNIYLQTGHLSGARVKTKLPETNPTQAAADQPPRSPPSNTSGLNPRKEEEAKEKRRTFYVGPVCTGGDWRRQGEGGVGRKRAWASSPRRTGFFHFPRSFSPTFPSRGCDFLGSFISVAAGNNPPIRWGIELEAGEERRGEGSGGRWFLWFWLLLRHPVAVMCCKCLPPPAGASEGSVLLADNLSLD
jgi:hypothetical protein